MLWLIRPRHYFRALFFGGDVYNWGVYPVAAIVQDCGREGTWGVGVRRGCECECECECVLAVRAVVGWEGMYSSLTLMGGDGGTIVCGLDMYPDISISASALVGVVLLWPVWLTACNSTRCPAIINRHDTLYSILY